MTAPVSISPSTGTGLSVAAKALVPAKEAANIEQANSKDKTFFPVFINSTSLCL